jgi:tol-pal system protein YbgF
MKKYIIFLPLILMVFAYGCATSADVDRVERQTAATNAQLRQIQGSIDDINYSLQAMNKRSLESFEMLKSVSQVKGSLKSLHEQTNTILRNQADLGNREFSSTSGGVSQGQIDEITHELSKLDEKMDAMKALLMQKLAEAQQAQAQGQAQGGAAAAGTATGAAQAGAAGTAGTTAPDPNQMYHQAYLDYTNGNYEIAVSEFREYLKDFPDAEFAGNAQFWIGESLYSMKKYDDALVELENVIENYPNSSKVADALVKEGYALDALKRPKEAKKAYAEVIKKYPDSDAAKLAAQRLKKKR